MMRKTKSAAKMSKPAGGKMRPENIDKTRLENIDSPDGNIFLSRRRLYTKFFGWVLSFVLISANVGCESPSLKANSSKPAANVGEDNIPGLEKDLQTMRNADFDFIYVFRRKDGAVLDGEDKKYLKANSPVFTNRFVLTDENKAAIAGSSYKFEPENLDILQKRFAIENFSKPESEMTPAANQNSGSANQNSGNTNQNSDK